MSSLSGPTLVDIPPKAEESFGTTTEKAAAALLTLSSTAASSASAPPTLGDSDWKPWAWEGLNWSRSSSSKAEHVLNRSRTLSSMSETSMSSYSESSRSSVDLHEDLNAKEIIIPTIALLPNMVTEVAASGRDAHDTFSNIPAAVNNPFQRRSAESTSQSWFRFFGNNDASARIAAIGNPNNNNNLPRPTRGQQASITARSRRSLMFLFLIALYTTFGLTVHNLPVAPELEFAGVNVIYPMPTTVSADFLSEQAEVLPKAEVSTTTTPFDEAKASTTSGLTKKNSIKNQIAFARRARQKLFFRPKEVKDFYQQQALAEEVDYSFFVNCGILALVVCWAWRERRSMSLTSSTSLPDMDNEPNMLV